MHFTFTKDVQAFHRRASRPDAGTAQPGTKKLAGGFLPIVQAKLRSGSSNDEYEQQADRVAEQVMRTADSCAPREALPVTPLAEREIEGTASSVAVPAIVNSVLSSPGQPLNSGTGDFMKQRFGCDFSSLRVHADAQAAASAQALHARAYTVGRDVVFGHGQYAPTTTDGKYLLAHEMTHVLQQNHSTPSIMKFGLGLGLGGCTVPPEECRHPAGYSIGPGTGVRDLERFGMEESPRIVEGESLKQVFVKELITQTLDYYSFLSWDEMESESDPYLNAADMPADAHLFPTARALNGYDKYVQENGPMKGTISFLQMYIYTMPKCGLTKPITLPNSGYRITHTLETGINGEVVATTSKKAESVVIYYEGEEFQTNAGLTKQIRPVKNQLRP